MKTTDRKAALAAYKEQKVQAGIFAVRHQPTGTVWVGSSPNLDKIQNRIWFSLRQGGHRGQSLQRAWNELGADDFTFEVVDRLEEEMDDYFRAAELKKRLAAWREKLGADLA